MKLVINQFIQSPKTSLLISSLLWKLLLIIIALTSPGPGYDTSTTLLPRLDSSHNPTVWSRVLYRLSVKLVRWDAIYFTQVARRGYVYEQEWFLGWGFTRLLAVLGRGVLYTWTLEICGVVFAKVLGLRSIGPGFDDYGSIEALLGAAVAHVCHVLSVLMLYILSKSVFESYGHRRSNVISLVSASLHIVSPAGMFLSAPYAESLFSLLQFIGFHLYSRSKMVYPSRWPISKELDILASGFLFGLATSVRSNGLLSGMIYAFDVVENVITFLRTHDGCFELRKLFVTVVAGLLVAAGGVYPQYLAYLEFCTGTQSDKGLSPWCNNYPPSIYAWVQTKYWNVGFLRYWTMSNIPLFVIAMPMLSILIKSTIWAWTELHDSSASNAHDIEPSDITSRVIYKGSTSTLAHSDITDTSEPLIRLLSLPQITLAFLAITNYHVQIITRLASGYPVWYWWLAKTICKDENPVSLQRNWNVPQIATRWMVMYAIIQGGLFASFLPPA